MNAPILILLFLALLSSGCDTAQRAAVTPSPMQSPASAGAASPSPTPAARWTWMMYVDANNDIELDELEDLKEMAAVGGSKDVNVIVLCARNPKSDEEEGYSKSAVLNQPDWTTCKLFEVRKGKLVQVADWGHVSMADGKTLQRFLETAMAAYPAQHYALNLNDHGLAWAGICGDETVGDGDDVLTLPALRDALKAGLRGRPLDLLGFDACLMANLEVAREVAPYARYMVASEEMEPAVGWDYEKTLRALLARPDMDAAALGRVIADTYLASFEGDEEKRDEGTGITLSVVDLAKLGPLTGALDALAAACSGSVELGREGWIRVAAARSRSEEYGASEEDGEASSDVYDVVSFAEAVSTRVPATRAAADDVKRAIGAAVIYSVHGRGRPAARGMSIFLPKKRSVLDEAAPLSYAEVVGAAGKPWLSFLELYTDATGRQKKAPALSSLRCKPRAVRDGKAAHVTAKTVPGELEEAWFVLGDRDGEGTMIIGQIAVEPDGGGLLDEEWDGLWFKISDGRNSVICPLSNLDPVEGKKGEYVGQVPAEWRRPGWKKWHDLTLHFYVREKGDGTASGRLTYAFEETKYGPRQVTLRKGDRLRPLYSEIQPDGEEVYVYSDEREDQLHITKPNGVSLVYTQVDAGTWRVGFVVKDYADNHAEAWTDVEVR